MNNYSKALLGTAAAGAMTMGAFATPAQAQSTEEIIAGAVIIGGIAAVLGAFDDDDDDRYYRGQRYRDDRYRDDRYARRGNGRQAVEQCVRIAENQARRAGYRYADVYEIYDVDRKRDGWKIKGRIAVEGQRGYRGARYDRRYDRRDRYDRRRVSDEGKFSCEVSYGRVRDLDFSGVRGLR
ncbi:MAG: hypothetical protein ABGW84_04825 [Sphingomonadaceae bacterium]|jgi:hypothetical protein